MTMQYLKQLREKTTELGAKLGQKWPNHVIFDKLKWYFGIAMLCEKGLSQIVRLACPN